MSEIKSRADLFEAAAKMMRMCDEAGVDYAFKYKELLHNFFPAFSGEFQHYEFPLAIVEGTPVFKGDELWHNFCGKCKVGGNGISIAPDNAHCFSWNPHKPKTVMVEMSVEDADRFFNSFDEYPDGLHGRIARACRKALEELK